MKNKTLVFAIIFCGFLTVNVFSQTTVNSETGNEKTVTEELKELESKSTAKTPKEVLEAGRIGNEQLRASGILKTALNVGEKMPEFTLNNAVGIPVKSSDLLKDGNLVVVFYRGSWCPYCNLYLRGLQKHLKTIKENGGNLVAISGETPDNSLTVEKKNNLEFEVLSDPHFDVARKFGIVYKVPKPINDVVLTYGLDFKQYYKTEESELPLSATYIVNQKGEIVYAFLEPDYKKRAEPSVIIETLKKMKGDSMKMDKMDKMDDKIKKPN